MMRVRVWSQTEPEKVEQEWAGVHRVDTNRDGSLDVYNRTNLLGSVSPGWHWIIDTYRER